MLTFLRMKPRELLARLQMLSVFIPTKVTCKVDPKVLNTIHMFKMVTMYVIADKRSDFSFL